MSDQTAVQTATVRVKRLPGGKWATNEALIDKRTGLTPRVDYTDAVYPGHPSIAAATTFGENLLITSNGEVVSYEVVPGEINPDDLPRLS